MRWLYYDPTDRTEAAEHDRVSRRIDDWWAEFRRNVDRLDQLFRQADQWDLPAWMNQHLQAINPKLMWEFGPAVSKHGHRLVITPEVDAEVRPLADEIVRRAPELDLWEFYTYRIPESVSAACSTVEGRTGLSVKDVNVAVALGEQNRIDLTWRWNRLPDDEEEAFNAAFIATETLLGEEAVDRWVGVIQLADESTPAEPGQRFLPLDRLRPTFESLVESTRAQLPSEPYSALLEDDNWALMKLEPEEAYDYPERYDLLTCVTCNSDLIAATFSNAPFYSDRYSRCGETFCYVKIDSKNADDMGFQDREDMEEAARYALEAEDTGAVIGSGTGLRYTYIELALTDVKRGIASLRRAMAEGNVSRRSWILFHDAHLAAEWIGIYEDSPAPPPGDPG